MKQGIAPPGETITSKTKTVIELTGGKKVLVQGIIGVMAATKEWYYDSTRKKIMRNVVIDRKKTKQYLLRYLLGLTPGDGIRARRIDTEDILSEDGKICENYLTNNLTTNRK